MFSACRKNVGMTISFFVVSVMLWPEEGDFPENLHHVICVIINKCSFESFVSYHFGSVQF